MKHILSAVEVLSPAEIEQIHRASLHVLQTVGGRLPHPRVLERMAQAGAEVDDAQGTVKLPPALVERALAQTPRSSPWVERENVGTETPARTFFRRKEYSAAPGNQALIVDYGSTARRAGTCEDVRRGIVLTNQLPYLDSCMPLVTPSDVPGALGDIYGYYLCALYSTKPFSVYLSDLFTAQTVLKMREVVRHEAACANDDAQVSFLLEPNGSLSFSTPSLEIALAIAEAGHHINVAPMVMAGMDAPFSLAGALVIQNAESLLGLVLCHLLDQPGGWSPVAMSLDPRSTMCSFGSPNHLLLQTAGMQLGRFYGFQNFWLNLGLTDACLPDFQGGFEKGASAMMALLAGAAGIGASGIVGADQATSFEQLVIDNEWASYVHHVFSQGFEVNDDTLALDVIEQVGIGGSYLAERHTARHARKTYWRSSLFNQGTWDAWMSDGGKDLHARAHEKVNALLAVHHPPQPVLSPAAIQALDSILEEAKQTVQA